MRYLLPTVLAALLASSVSRAVESPQFNRDIRPILAENCFACHGFDAKTREADLRLDVPEGAYADRDGKSAIKPGNLSASELWKRITSDDPDYVMPPPDTKKTLTAREKSTLRVWIEQGARYQKHWAFEAPVRPTEPVVKNGAWPRGPVDRFLLARLEQEGLSPQPEADRETLIRRVAFTLTGLPPTIAEVDRFLNDGSAAAYADMVDRYLSSAAFGEEQARHWLDVARYADTHGLHLDNEREMWAYRDWVVKAFNSNLPFDRFTTWQLAGDLLPDATLDQLVATGFNRCNVTTSEGGSIAPEWIYRYAVDRTSTTIQAWMGLTAGCAVCHDHKYDPLSTKEFYSLYAFFYSAADPAMDGNIINTNPYIQVPTPRQADQLNEARQREAVANKQLEAALGTVQYAEPADSNREVVDTVIDDDFPRGARVQNTSRNDVAWRLDPGFGAKSGRRVIEISYGGPFDISVDLNLIPVVVPQDGRIELWLRVDPHDPPRAFAVQLDNHRAVWGAEDELPGKVQDVTIGPMPAGGEWTKLSAPFDKLSIKPGTRIKKLVLAQVGGRLWLDAVQLAGSVSSVNDPLSSFKAWWTQSKGTNPEGIAEELKKVLVGGPKDDVAEELRAKLTRFYLQHVQRASESPVKDLRTAARAAEIDRICIESTIPGTFAFRDLDSPRDAFVMLRGQYDKPGDKVEPAVPAIFPPLNTKGRASRLDLAHWLLAPEHPLTARVAANRMWQQVFGIGLVQTSDDFGTRGEAPSHPELLDWLAIEFRETGWDVKRFLRMLITSSAFRQRSTITPEVNRRDPQNRLLARGPRFRLDAEQLRDNALFVSGLLNPTMGGRGDRPYQPPNIWEPVGYENSNTRFYIQDHGGSLYRRSLYAFIKRTAPPPFMTNFDGPNREQFCTLRQRSNTPLQALQLMNDVQHFEAARALAERTIEHGGTNDEARITFLYRAVLARRPTKPELAMIGDALRTQRALFQAEPKSAYKAIEFGESKPRNLAPAPETAAWTLVANLVLNLDETVTRN